MSLVRLNIKSRIELETRVLAAALKQSFERQDAQGVSLAHRQLFLLLKDAGRSDETGVATVHFSDGVPPGLPVAPGADEPASDSDQAPAGAEERSAAEFLSEREPAGADEPAMAVTTIDPLFSLPSTVDSTKSYSSVTDAGPSHLTSRLWGDGLPDNSHAADSPSSRADTTDLSEFATAQPGSLAARLYAEPLFGEHKAAPAPATGDERTGQKTTLDRLPAARVAPEANIDDSSIGQLNDKQESAADSETERLDESSADALAARMEGAGEDDEPTEEPRDVFGPADEYFPHQAPPPELTPEAALAQLAQSGYGSGVSSAYQIGKQDETKEPDGDSEGDDDAFSNPGGIVDAPYVVNEGNETGDNEPDQMTVAERELVVPNVVPPAGSEPVQETFAPDVEPDVLKLESAGSAKGAVSKPAQAEAEAEESEEPRKPDIYMLLDVSQMSPFEDIHRNFLRKVRRLLREIKGNKAERYPKLAELQRLWIAHDILTDPVTRTDYDFRDMGLRGTSDSIVPHAPEDQQQARLNNRTPLRIGELLQCAGLLETAELEIACDMHKAMPEMQFGTFLVRQGFIQERDLESVLLGQRLLRDGAITVAQFQVAMELSQSRGSSISETLIEKGYLSESDLESITSNPAEEAPAPPVVQIREISVVKKSEKDPAANKSTWRDQLDWGSADSDKGSDDQQVSGGLGGLLRAQTPAAPGVGESAQNVVERKMKISKPEGQSDLPPVPMEAKKAPLDVKNAVPSWKDQLDWAESDTAKPQPATENEPPPAIPQKPVKELRISNAVPTWKDQLDWSSPSEESTAANTEQFGVSTAENQPLQLDKELEFAPAEESPEALRQAAQESAKEHSAVELDLGQPLRIKGQTTGELEIVDLDNDMRAATLLDPEAYSSRAETTNFPPGVGEGIRAQGSRSGDITAEQVNPLSADEGEHDDEEDSSSQTGKRDKKKKSKDKRKKKR